MRTAAPAPDDLDRALLLALSVFPIGADGKPAKRPGPATLVILRRADGRWQHEVLQDPESNVFHKALAFAPPRGGPGILTIGGGGARLKLWRRVAGEWTAETLWAPDFGGKHNRLRDMELADLDGDGQDEIVLATHDQGVVAIVAVTERGPEVRELDRRANTFVHEVEVGDVDGDGHLEIFATPSLPNRFDGTPQSGRLIRYRPERSPGRPGARQVFVDLGERHAKEVLVRDLDGDGHAEVYLSVEGRVQDGVRVESVEIRRYRRAGDPGATIARLDDSLCRSLTAADVDGDGSLELVAAPFRAGVYLLWPPASGAGPFTSLRIARDSSSFEHAVAAFDLDHDGRDEIYVAADDQGVVRRYVWQDDAIAREDIFQVPDSLRGFTWNITSVPLELVK